MHILNLIWTSRTWFFFSNTFLIEFCIQTQLPYMIKIPHVSHRTELIWPNRPWESIGSPPISFWYYSSWPYCICLLLCLHIFLLTSKFTSAILLLRKYIYIYPWLVFYEHCTWIAYWSSCLDEQMFFILFSGMSNKIKYCNNNKNPLGSIIH